MEFKQFLEFLTLEDSEHPLATDSLTMMDDEMLMTQLTFISSKFRKLTEGITKLQGRLSLTESVSILLETKIQLPRSHTKENWTTSSKKTQICKNLWSLVWR